MSPSSFRNKSIAVAVSGGADSLHTLISLKEAGADVIAVHGIFGQQLLHEFLLSSYGMQAIAQTGGYQEDPHPAMLERLKSACASIDVPLHIVDCTKEFLQKVIRPFVALYAAGRTPNPCALCNAGIKFGSLLEKSLALGATHLATGHYARLLYDTPSTDAFGKHTPALLQGNDPLKDQSYFLALTLGSSLAKAIFPLGERRKSDVLADLRKRGILPPQEGESQEVCFIPGNCYRLFVPFMAERLGIPLSGPGPMLLEDGFRIGTHKGLWQYTEGQRKGLGIGWKEPLHVLGKEQQGNILRLGGRESLNTTKLTCENLNFLVPPETWPSQVFVKTRYRESPKKAYVVIERTSEHESLHISLAEDGGAVASGQLAAVYVPFYLADGTAALRVAAGGIIEKTEQ